MTIKKCCTTDSCSELYSTQCVIFTGELNDDSYISLEGCSSNLNQVILEIDRLLIELKDNDGILRSELLSNNCSFSDITDLVNSNLTTKIKTADTVLALLKTLCALQTRISTLENLDIFETILSQDLQLLVNSKAVCLDVDPCNTGTLTLGELLRKLIYLNCP